MNKNDMQLLIQLKILKELRILNKTLTKGLKLTYGRVDKQYVLNDELDDVKEIMAAVGQLNV